MSYHYTPISMAKIEKTDNTTGIIHITNVNKVTQLLWEKFGSFF